MDTSIFWLEFSRFLIKINKLFLYKMVVFFIPKRSCASDYNFFVTFRIAFRFHMIKSEYKKAIPYKFERNRSTLPYSTMPLVRYPLRPKVSGIHRILYQPYWSRSYLRFTDLKTGPKNRDLTNGRTNERTNERTYIHWFLRVTHTISPSGNKTLLIVHMERNVTVPTEIYS